MLLPGLSPLKQPDTVLPNGEVRTLVTQSGRRVIGYAHPSAGWARRKVPGHRAAIE